ncbi:EamA-like transporter family protein [Enhydrobacter aerosaccus]|uniref:EamA-like transporter family protein n=1 Tax=Enhydrobacter aerosaccus TaxID=225324 RepID=A0A1T4JSK1_9HYPH|nr:DMT family transporter [Enhydrobacter aerosaccus]SJZ33037.1 EamA-like transporter family protein [Enhydrobacter aerosaccus]
MTSLPPTTGRRASLVLLFAALIWGSMIPVLAALAEHYDKWLLSWLRYVLGMPVLWLAVWMTAPPKTKTRPVRPLQLLSLGAAMTAFSVLYTFGVSRSHPATAAIVLTCGPIWATLLARLMLRTPMPPGFFVTLVLVLTGGVLVVLGTPQAAAGLGFRGGELLLVIAQFCWSWYSIRAQQWLADRGQIALSALTSTVASGLLGLVCIGVWMSIGIEWPTHAPTALDLGMIAWVGVLGVAVAILLWNVGVSMVGVPIASLYSNSAPIFAIGLAAFMGKEPTWLQVAGGAVVLGAIALLQARQIRTGRR